MKTSTRTSRRRTNPMRVIMTRSICKKQQQQEANTNNKPKGLLMSNNSSAKEEEAKKSTSSTTTSTSEDDVVCSTPRGKKYMIPKISTCPPAPIKKRLVLNPAAAAATANIKFFSHPELDVFFLFSPRNSNSNRNRVPTLDSNQAQPQARLF